MRKKSGSRETKHGDMLYDLPQERHQWPQCPRKNPQVPAVTSHDLIILTCKNAISKTEDYLDTSGL